MRKIPSLKDMGDVEEYGYMLKIIEKLKYSSKTYTEQEITEILNPYHQQNLTKLVDVAKRNKPISVTKIAETLYRWCYIRVYNNICYSRKPYTYNYIMPILKNGRLVNFDEELVLERKVEDKLQEYCNQQLS